MTARLASFEPVLGRGGVRLDLFRPTQMTDDYLRWINDPEIMRYTEARFASYTQEDAREYVVSSNAGDDARLFRICADERHVGNLRVSAINWHHRRAEIAIIIGEREHHGRGIGTTAVSLASEWCFSALGMRKLCAGMYEENRPSIRAFEKAGFRIEAKLKDHYLLDGRPMDAVMMARFA
jgi:RimJ/RimL family protein N-acetyltransferase